MSDESTIRILPPQSTTIGGDDTGPPKSPETKAASTEIVSRPIVVRAALAPVVHSNQPSAKSPEIELKKSIEADLREVEVTWRRYQATHDRDAVYGYLSAVYKVVMKWKTQRRAWKSAGLALKLQGAPTSIRVEPFAVVIRCTSSTAKVDAKTRSKWSRALRVAEAFKGRETSVKAFIKGQGGINKCAARAHDIPEKR